MRSYILMTLLLLKEISAASASARKFYNKKDSELNEEVFDGYKDIRDGIKGSMTREFQEVKTSLFEGETFDGYKDIRDGIKGSMTREFQELQAPAKGRLHLSKPSRSHHQRPMAMGLDFLINNETLDKLFAGLRLRFAKNGPVTIPLPADQDEFTIELFNNTMDGHVSVYGGKIQGLESIHRTGDTKLDINPLRGEATFTTSIGLNDLSASYYGSLFLKGLGADAGLDLSVSHIELHVKMYAKVKLLKMQLEKLEIQELSFPEVGSLESHIKLTGILDPVIDTLLDTVLNLVVGQPIFDSLSDILKQLINDMLADMDVSALSPFLKHL